MQNLKCNVTWLDGVPCSASDVFYHSASQYLLIIYSYWKSLHNKVQTFTIILSLYLLIM